MGARERVAYLKGLMDGRGAGDDPTRPALLTALEALCDELEELRGRVDENQDDCRELYALCDGLDADLGDLEARLDEMPDDLTVDDLDDESDADDLDQEFEETTCPQCGTCFFFHPTLVEDGGVRCPGCDGVVPIADSAEQTNG